MQSGEQAFTMEASVHTILTCERLDIKLHAKNEWYSDPNSCRYVDKIKGYSSKILDTRKTTPGFRLLEKEAVRIGGGMNHRFGLFDMIMLKDNHIDYCGGIGKALDNAFTYVQKYKPIT